ncbi:MAG: transposase [Chthoniobacterales bacterium]
MAEPPRLSEILLPWEKSIIYFDTLCVQNRRKILANPETFEAIRRTLPQLRKWHVWLAAVIMPDHVHVIVSPVEDRGVSIGDFSHGFKRILRKTLKSQMWEWQRGYFDRLLRFDENLTSKWIYMRDNPVRHGFVEKAEDWRYHLDLVNTTGGNCQLPLQSQQFQSMGVGG